MNNSEKRVTKSIYCVYFSSYRFDFIQHDFHEQHTHTHKSANAKASEIHKHTTKHIFVYTRPPLTHTNAVTHFERSTIASAANKIETKTCKKLLCPV